MPTKKPARRRPNVIIIIGLIVALLVAGTIVWYARYHDNEKASTKSTQRDQSGVEDDADDSAANQDVYQGEFVCLPHKDTSGPQTMECAFGLKTSDGTYYALHEDQPGMILGGLPTGKEITVTGSLKTEDSDIYQSKGVITVTKAALAE